MPFRPSCHVSRIVVRFGTDGRDASSSNEHLAPTSATGDASLTRPVRVPDHTITHTRRQRRTRQERPERDRQELRFPKDNAAGTRLGIQEWRFRLTRSLLFPAIGNCTPQSWEIEFQLALQL
jgi:hypothetical protein